MQSIGEHLRRTRGIGIMEFHDARGIWLEKYKVGAILTADMQDRLFQELAFARRALLHGANRMVKAAPLFYTVYFKS